ncbi:hypothetical protein CerSpe_277010 [Prunus speciosa]
MAVQISGGFQGLNPYAPEFFPNQNLLSLSGSIIPSYFYPPPPLVNPNQYSSFYFSYFHQTNTTTFDTNFTSSDTNYSFNPLFPTQSTQQAPLNFLQPSTEPTLTLPHEEHGLCGVQNQEAKTVPRPPRRRAAKGYYRNKKRCPFGHGGLGSSFNESRRGTYCKCEKEREVRPRLGFVNSYDKGFDNWKSNGMGNNWLVPKKVRSKQFADVLPVVRGGDNTTVMIRNIPNKYNRDLLMAFLDAHCAIENKKHEKLGREGGDNSTLISAYDFLYLPIDFQTGFNKGYAFVNFTSREAVWKFYKAAHGQAWELFHSTKIRQIAYAKIQGKKELVRHFETMGFPCESEDVLPVSFEPPRDGLRRLVLRTTVGKRIFREEEKSQQ